MTDLYGDNQGPLRVHGHWTLPARQVQWAPPAAIGRSVDEDWIDVWIDTSCGQGTLLGWSDTELQAIDGSDLVHPDDRHLLDIAGAGASRHRSGFVPVELRLLARDGRYWWTGWYDGTSSANAGELCGVEYLRPAGWGCPVATWSWNVDRDVIAWAPELLDMIGLDVGAPATLQAFLAGVVDDDRDDVNLQLHVAATGRAPFRFTFRCPTETEREAWFYAAGRCRLHPDGSHVLSGLVKYLNPPWDVQSPPIGDG